VRVRGDRLAPTSDLDGNTGPLVALASPSRVSPLAPPPPVASGDDPWAALEGGWTPALAEQPVASLLPPAAPDFVPDGWATF